MAKTFKEFQYLTEPTNDILLVGYNRLTEDEVQINYNDLLHIDSSGILHYDKIYTNELSANNILSNNGIFNTLSANEIYTDYLSSYIIDVTNINVNGSLIIGNTLLSSTNAISVGEGNEIHAPYIITVGRFNKLKASYAFASGVNNNVLSEYSHIEGSNNIAASEYQHVQGQYNEGDYSNKYADIIGNGYTFPISITYSDLLEYVNSDEGKAAGCLISNQKTYSTRIQMECSNTLGISPQYILFYGNQQTLDYIESKQVALSAFEGKNFNRRVNIQTTDWEGNLTCNNIISNKGSINTLFDLAFTPRKQLNVNWIKGQLVNTYGAIIGSENPDSDTGLAVIDLSGYEYKTIRILNSIFPDYTKMWWSNDGVKGEHEFTGYTEIFPRDCDEYLSLKEFVYDGYYRYLMINNNFGNQNYPYVTDPDIYVANKSGALLDKKITIFGDSISTESWNYGCLHWFDYLTSCGATIINNFANPGDTLSLIKIVDGAASGSVLDKFETYKSQLGNTDIIIFYAGINDYALCNTGDYNLGTIFDTPSENLEDAQNITQLKTFCENFKFLCNDINISCPGKEIIFVLPVGAANVINNPKFSFEDLNKTITIIAHSYGFKVINPTDMYGFNPFISAIRQKMFDRYVWKDNTFSIVNDGTHLGYYGHKFLGDACVYAISNGVYSDNITPTVGRYYIQKINGVLDYTQKGEIFNDYNNNIASGNYSHAEGYNTRATSNYTHSEGGNTQATGEYGHAEGSGTIASAAGSHAQNYNTKASGNYSHAEGYGCQAQGESSHAQGRSSVASAEGAFAAGRDAYAQSRYQTVLGTYNIPDNTDTYGLIIGNGTSNSNKSNALSLKWDGTLEIAKAIQLPIQGSEGEFGYLVLTKNDSGNLNLSALSEEEFSNL